MNTKNIILSLTLAAICGAPVFAKTTTIIELGQGGTLNWNGSPPPALNCTKDGDDCKITITTVVNNIVSNGDYWNVDADLTAGGATVYPSGSAPLNYSISVNSFTFDTGYLVIESGWFSGIPAMSIPLAGFSSDASGHVSFDVLKSSCIY